MIFRFPGVFLTWGIRNAQWTPDAIAQKVHDHGFRWLAQEIGDPETEPPDAQIALLRAACHRLGLYFGTWEVSPRNLVNFNRYRPNLWVIDAESDEWPGYDNLLTELRKKHPLLPVGVSTDTAIDHKVFIKHNVKVLPQAYQVADSADLPPDDRHTPENMVGLCRRLGWRVVFPTLGAYHDYPLSDYALTWGNDGVDGWSVYAAEMMTDADWLTAQNMAKA